MAKAKDTSLPNESNVPAGITITFPANTSFSYDGGFTIRLADMVRPLETMLYLADRGNTENMTNVGAIDAKKRAKILADCPAGTDHDAFVAAWVLDRRTKKAAATLAGEFTIRHAGPSDPLSAEMRKIAVRMITEGCRNATPKIPVPVKDALDATVTKVLAKHDAKIRAEAEANLAKAKEMVGLVDLADIVAAVEPAAA